MSRPTTAEPVYFRPALLPAALLGLALVTGVATQALGTAEAIRYIVSILAVIVGVFAVQARAWLWLLPLAAIAVAWNPVLPFGFSGVGWNAAHIFAAAVSFAAALFIRQKTVSRAR